MHFGALMLRAGNAAFRVRQWMNELARAMGIDALDSHCDRRRHDGDGAPRQ
jgi:hypothetical protein